MFVKFILILFMAKKLKFIDLYAGLGGFHQALSALGHEGVWASEYNTNLRKLYRQNFRHNFLYSNYHL